MVFQYLESTLHTLVVATSDKPRTSLQAVRNNLCHNGMHKLSEQVYCSVPGALLLVVLQVGADVKLAELVSDVGVVGQLRGVDDLRPMVLGGATGHADR